MDYFELSIGIKCHEEGISTAEMFEIFTVANIVGGTIVIPHTRRAVEFWEELAWNNVGNVGM